MVRAIFSDRPTNNIYYCSFAVDDQWISLIVYRRHRCVASTIFFVGGYSFRRRNSPEDTCTVCSKRVMNNVTQSCSGPLELETGIRIVECHKNTELPSSKIRANILY